MSRFPVFEDGELDGDSVVRNLRTTGVAGKSYEGAFYNLGMVLRATFTKQLPPPPEEKP